MSTAVIYTRVSTAEQAETESLNQQERACRDFADKKDIVVDRVFMDAGESAKTADRPKLVEMLNYCKENRENIQYVIVWKVDRFARRTEDHLMLKAILIKLGIQLISVTEPIEDSTTGRLMETILAGFAEFDNGMRSERSSNGMRSRLEQGGWVHVAPIGYDNVKDVLGRPTIAPNEMSGNVQKLLKEFAKGIYTQTMAIKLAQDMKITTRKGHLISSNGVRKLLKNPIYCGLVWGSMLPEPIWGLHDPLISLDEYKNIQAILNGHKRDIRPEERRISKLPLRRFLLCGQCKHPLTGSTSKGRSKLYSYYHCTKCRGMVRVSSKLAHDQFAELLKLIKPNQGRLKLFKVITLRKWDEEHREVQSHRRKIDEQIREHENTKNLLIHKNIRGVIDDDTTRDQLESISLKKTELELIRNDLKINELTQEAIIDSAIQFITDASSLWQQASLENKQRFQKMIFPYGIEYKFGTGFGTAELGQLYTFASIKKDPSRSEESLLVAHCISNWHQIKKELISWHSILSVSTQQHLAIVR